MLAEALYSACEISFVFSFTSCYDNRAGVFYYVHKLS